MSQHELNLGYLYRNPMGVLLCLFIDLITLPLIVFRKQKPPNEIKNILIIKPDHMGDMVLALGAVEQIHHHYPQARLHLIHSTQASPILDMNDCSVISYPVNHYKLNRSKVPKAKKIIKYLLDTKKAISILRREEIDLSINLRAFGPNLAWIPFAINSKYSVAHGTAGFKYLNDMVPKWTPGTHEIVHHLEILKTLLPKLDLHSIYPQIGKTKEFLIPESQRLELPQSFTLIHVGSGDPRKMLTPSQWQSIIEKFNPANNIVFCGLPHELSDFKKFHFSRKAIFIDKIELDGLCNLIQSAEFIYCLDSLVMHLAWAMNKSAHVIFCGSDANQWAPLSDKISWSTYENTSLG